MGGSITRILRIVCHACVISWWCLQDVIASPRARAEIWNQDFSDACPHICFVLLFFRLASCSLSGVHACHAAIRREIAQDKVVSKSKGGPNFGRLLALSCPRLLRRLKSLDLLFVTTLVGVRLLHHLAVSCLNVLVGRDAVHCHRHTVSLCERQQHSDKSALRTVKGRDWHGCNARYDRS